MSTVERLQQMAELYQRQEEKVAELEGQLKEAKKEFNRTKFEDLPLLMEEVGFSEVRLNDGRRIKLTEDFDASITAATRDRAVQWLVQHGHAGLVKTEVAVRFGRGEHDKAVDVTAQLSGDYDEVEMRETVHPQTLKAWVRERMAEGEAIPMDLFNVRPYTYAKPEK